MLLALLLATQIQVVATRRSNAIARIGWDGARSRYPVGRPQTPALERRLSGRVEPFGVAMPPGWAMLGLAH